MRIEAEKIVGLKDRFRNNQGGQDQQEYVFFFDQGVIVSSVIGIIDNKPETGE